MTFTFILLYQRPFVKKEVHGLSEKNSNAAKIAQREYARQWRRKNPEKVRAINRRYWERRAAKLQASEGRTDDAKAEV